jgi:hypothetical protein
MLARFKTDTRAGANQCIEYLLSLLWDLYIWDENVRARQTVYANLESGHDYADQLNALITRHRGTLTVGGIDNPLDRAHGWEAPLPSAYFPC